MSEFKNYEYKTITVKKAAKYRILDALEAFGYQLIETKELPNSLIISLKREEIKEKEELDKKMDLVINKIEELVRIENNKKSLSTIFGLSFGILGLLTFGGGMSWVLTGNKDIASYVGGTLLGLVGILIMIINEPIYKMIYQKSISKKMPKIDELNNEINKLLKEGNELLKNSLK